MRPGETVWPSRSITCASAGTTTAPAAPTAAITPPRTITTPFSMTFPGDVTTRAFTSAYTCGSSAAERVFAKRKTKTKRREDFFERVRGAAASPLPEPFFMRIAFSTF